MRASDRLNELLHKKQYRIRGRSNVALFIGRSLLNQLRYEGDINKPCQDKGKTPKSFDGIEIVEVMGLSPHFCAIGYTYDDFKKVDFN